MAGATLPNRCAPLLCFVALAQGAHEGISPSYRLILTRFVGRDRRSAVFPVGFWRALCICASEPVTIGTRWMEAQPAGREARGAATIAARCDQATWFGRALGHVTRRDNPAYRENSFFTNAPQMFDFPMVLDLIHVACHINFRHGGRALMRPVSCKGP